MPNNHQPFKMNCGGYDPTKIDQLLTFFLPIEMINLHRSSKPEAGDLSLEKERSIIERLNAGHQRRYSDQGVARRLGMFKESVPSRGRLRV